MFIIPLVILLSIGSLVLLAGLASLHYFKKEGKGKLHKIIAYTAATCGSLIMIGGLVVSILVMTCGKCHKGKCNDRGAKCHVEMCSDCDSKKSCDSKCDKEVEKEIKVTITEE